MSETVDWRKTLNYSKWAKGVKNRDKKCVVCCSEKRLHAHHMNHANFCKNERYNVNNGITLCHSCHSNFHTNYKRSYDTKCTTYDFCNFLSLVRKIKNPLQCNNKCSVKIHINCSKVLKIASNQRDNCGN